MMMITPGKDIMDIIKNDTKIIVITNTGSGYQSRYNPYAPCMVST